MFPFSFSIPLLVPHSSFEEQINPYLLYFFFLFTDNKSFHRYLTNGHVFDAALVPLISFYLTLTL